MKINSPSNYRNNDYQCDKCNEGKKMINIDKYKGIVVTCNICVYEYKASDIIKESFRKALDGYLA